MKKKTIYNLIYSINNRLSFLFMYDYYYLENNHNNAVQIRPSIPRRPSLTRFTTGQNLLITSQVHHQQEQQPKNQTKRQFDSEIENDEGIDSAVESRSLSINTSDDGLAEVNSKLFFH